MKLRMRSLIGLMLSLMTVVMFGCGDDGGGSPTTVKGVAAAGPIVGGTVTLFKINPDGTTTQLTTTPAVVTTKPTLGNYSAAVSYSGPLLVQVTGGTYTDEATNVQSVPNGTLSAVVPNVTGTVANISVTPHTTVAAQLAQFAPGATVAEKITFANTQVAKALRVPAGVDITTTPVTDPNYAFALSAFSQGALNAVAASGGDIASPTALAAASANIVNGLSAIDQTTGQPAIINITTGTVTDPATNQAITQAIQDATNNENIPVPPTIILTDPAGVSLSAAPATGVINNNVTITATVSAIGSTSTVPDGTTVTFTASAGSITASAITTGGIATATLNGITTEQAVTVNASVGTIAAAPLTVNFINDPNAPGSISVTANPTSSFVNQTVTITATVAPAGAGGVIADGTPVTFATTLGTIPAATTTGGVATATLSTGATAGTASVTATAGGVTSPALPIVIGAQPTTAIVTISTTGNLLNGDRIVGIDTVLSIPVGLTVALDANQAQMIENTGTVPATGTLIVPNVINPVEQTPGTARIILAHIVGSNATGSLITQTGPAIQVTFAIAAGTFPQASDFSLANSSVSLSNLPGVVLTSTIGLTISNVVIQ